MTNGENSLAFFLAKQGYDVWLGNNRTCKLEYGHLDTNSSEFWNWSLDELAKFDVPAMVNYILYSTKLTKLSYIGHSQMASADIWYEIIHACHDYGVDAEEMVWRNIVKDLKMMR